MKKLFSLLIPIAALCLWGFTVPKAPFRIVFAGDSITDGAWGGSNGTKRPSSQRNHHDLNHIYGHSYMMLCAARLSADRPTEELYFYNRGISGNSLADLELRWKEDILSLHPDLISILIGTNDVHYHLLHHAGEDFDYKDWERRYRKLLDEAQKENPNVMFIIGTPFVAKVGQIGEAADYETRADMVKELDKIVEHIAEDYHARLIRYDELFKSQSDKYPDVAPNHWIWDGIHPSPAGHQLMADEWLKVFYRL